MMGNRHGNRNQCQSIDEFFCLRRAQTNSAQVFSKTTPEAFHFLFDFASCRFENRGVLQFSQSLYVYIE